ncbi:MAG TPA: hypothetical protein VIL49_11125 [Capillimicrobium sp.]
MARETLRTRYRSTVWLAITVAALAALMALAPAPAEAARKPTDREAAAIKRVALRACSPPGRPCRYAGARVSTANRRYAWANVFTDGFSGALVKRPTRRSQRFHVVGTQGGGIGECSYWRERAPRRVLRDLRISGLLGAGTRVGRCG